MPPSPADFSGVENWVFDLDNTLYPATSRLFTQIDLRMGKFIAETLDLAPDAARALQKQYFLMYGTTMRGLALQHGIDPEIYLAYIHDIDHSVLLPAPRLAAAIARLPGRKLIFTNSSAKHADLVLNRLGLSTHFEAIFDIRAAAYVPKPDAEAYGRLVRTHALDARRSAMFDDIPGNLRPAAALGMRTVWVRRPDQDNGATTGGDDGHIHHVTDELTDCLERLAAGSGFS